MSDGFSDFFYLAQDGLKLHARIYGPAGRDNCPVICLPGLTRNVRDFHQLALYLSGKKDSPRQVICFDYRGRGQSAYDRNWHNYDPIIEARDIIAGLTALNVEHGAFIGTSRGGLIMFVLAAMRPGLIKCGILNDVGPVIEGAGVALIRAYLEWAPIPKNWPEAIEIQRAAGGPGFSSLTDADWERGARAFYRDENGVPVTDYDPALLKTVTSVNLNEPLPVFWPQFQGLAEIPLLVIRGANSTLLSAETVAEMEKRHPDLVAINVDGQGHAPYLETAGLPKRIAKFIERVEGR